MTMAKITDYRTETQKRREAMHRRIFDRYNGLRAEGLSRHRACVVASQENGTGVSTVYDIVRRLETETGQTN